MADLYSGKLQLWDGWAPATYVGRESADRLPTDPPAEVALRLYAAESLLRLRRVREMAEPYSLQWYLDVEHARYARHGRWVPRALEFAKHRGETLLGLGNGLGTDWVQYARHGASVIACSPSTQHLHLIQRNFELRQLPGRFVHGSPDSLPVEPASIDVVCLHNLPLKPDELPGLADEVYRVLRPGGKVLAVLTAHYDVDYWFRRCLPLRGLFRRTKPSPTSAGHRASELKRIFHRYSEHRFHRRHLRRGDLPHVLRWLPLPVLERVFGRLVIFKAFKPLSAAISVPLAA